MRVARLWITPELLLQQMGFPAETRILDATMHDADGRYIVLTVSHPDLKDVTLADDEAPPLIAPLLKQQPTTVLVSWGQE